MIPLTPARRALLQRLLDTGGIHSMDITASEQRLIARMGKEHPAMFRTGITDARMTLRITAAGRAALKETL